MPQPVKKPLKIAIVTCYDQNDYVRARTLRTAFAACPGVRAIVLKNKHRGLLRYIEVPLKFLVLRFRQRPDAYVVTFRGYEMLLFMLCTLVRRPIIFDEMINFVEYFEEHNRLRPGTLMHQLVRRFYRWQLRQCRFILADTPAHARYSAQLCAVPEDRFRVVPLGTDEQVFYPQNAAPRSSKRPFKVFYYGNGMTPLHGLQYVLDAAVLLKDSPQISFSVVGGHHPAAQACADAAAQGARLTYEAWVPFEQLPARARAASLCLGGPFGNTTQANMVVTGKTVQFLALACPVLVGKNKVSEDFADHKNCLLVPQANAPAIADAVRWAAKHPAELQAIGRAGRALYERRFSQSVINGLVASLVKELS